MSKVSLHEAAKLMGISSATLRNWVKAGHLQPASARPLLLWEDAVLDLKNKIGRGFWPKLQTRANKANSATQRLPEEYTEDSGLITHIAGLMAALKGKRLAIETAVFYAALRFLHMNGEVQPIDHPDPLAHLAAWSWTRKSMQDVLLEWHTTLPTALPHTPHLYEQITPYASDDFLGLFYQALLREGDKSEQGAYYTPTPLVQDSLSAMDGRGVQTFLDPCCGSGNYLLQAAQTFNLEPQNIYGFDKDRIAVFIARINLLLAFKGKEFSPPIFCLDSLLELATGDILCSTNHLLGKVDAIATNPPWGAAKNVPHKTLFSSRVKSGETFALFLERSLQLLRHGGQLSFLLPESFLKIKTHADIRAIILGETQITQIALLGRPFSAVFTPVIRLDLVKRPPVENGAIVITQNSKSDTVLQERFKHNTAFAFDIATGSHEAYLLQKMMAVPHETLAHHAAWALGIVTGDNQKYLLHTPAEGAEPIFRGSDVVAYGLKEPKTFIHFTPQQFQQVAPERLFRVPEKLIYKFISKKLVFAYDDQQRLTLNSANLLIPALPHLSLKVVLGFLNSTAVQYLFQKKFATHKVLRGDLEKLPFPFIDPTTHALIENLVERALVGQNVSAELDDIIFSTFELNAEDIFIIKQAIGE